MTASPEEVDERALHQTKNRIVAVGISRILAAMLVMTIHLGALFGNTVTGRVQVRLSWHRPFAAAAATFAIPLLLGTARLGGLLRFCGSVSLQGNEPASFNPHPVRA